MEILAERRWIDPYSPYPRRPASASRPGPRHPPQKMPGSCHASHASPIAKVDPVPTRVTERRYPRGAPAPPMIFRGDMVVLIRGYYVYMFTHSIIQVCALKSSPFVTLHTPDTPPARPCPAAETLAPAMQNFGASRAQTETHANTSTKSSGDRSTGQPRATRSRSPTRGGRRISRSGAPTSPSILQASAMRRLRLSLSQAIAA